MKATLAEQAKRLTPVERRAVKSAYELLGPNALEPELMAMLHALGVEPRYLPTTIRVYRWLYGDLVGLLPKMRQHRPERAGLMVGPTPYGHDCRYCGAPATSIDHVWPKSRGGDDHPNNLVPACFMCNSVKSDRSWLTDSCDTCQAGRDPSDVVTSSGEAFYHCRCGATWSRTWDLQRGVHRPAR